MKKITSILLVTAMLSSLVPMNTFAAESVDVGGYNSLKLPVINEVIDEDSEAYATSSMSSLSASSSSVASAQTPTVTVTGITKQTAKKGGMLTISNVSNMLSASDKEKVVSFYNLCEDIAVLEYEKDGKTSTMIFAERLLRNYYSDDVPLELAVPVPKELENGTYTVKVHQLNSTWVYAENGCSELVFTFELDVTDADNSSAAEPYSLNTITALADESMSMLEGDRSYNGYPSVSFKEPLDDTSSMIGFARDKDGAIYALSGSSDGNKITCDYVIANLPVGKYDCYFAETSTFDKLYGPVELNITPIAFEDKYINNSSKDNYTRIDLAESTAKKIIDDVDSDNCTLNIAFKNKSGTTVRTMTDIEVEWFSINEYGGDINFYLNTVGFDTGFYYAEVTLKDGNGTSYNLGETVLNITDKPIIDKISIINYDGNLTTSTDSFYVKIDISDIFIDYDKININLLDSKGNVVAKTVSKELKDLSSWDGSDLLYKLKVSEKLNSGSYTLDIQSNKDTELVSNVNSVSVRVTDEAKVVRTEIAGLNTIKIYTENLLPGEYLIADTLSNAEETYNIVIDEQGTGTFPCNTEADYAYHHYYLKNIVSEDEYDYIDSFDFEIRNEDEYEYDYFYSSPEFISVNTKKIENFSVRPFVIAGGTTV